MRNLLGSTVGVGNAAFIPTPLSSYWVELTSSPTLVPIPAGAKYAVFSFPDGNYGVVYGDENVEAEIPSTSGIPTALNDWNPSQRLLSPTNTHMSMIAPEAHDGLVSFYT